MSSSRVPSPSTQVQSYFDSVAGYWQDVYRNTGLLAYIYQRRAAFTLNWIKELNLAPGERCLDVGCGAGILSATLASWGCRVDAVDLAPNMLELARAEAERHGVGARVSTALGDVHRLQFPEHSFGLVVALGVLPWVDDPQRALEEMARVLRPGGYLIVSVDNRWRLDHLLDPLSTPMLRKVRRAGRRTLAKLQLISPETRTPVRYQSPPECRAALAAAGLCTLKCASVGFGPFTFMKLKLLPDRLGIVLHRRLQALAERKVAPLNSIGVHYLALATKPLQNGDD
jgi:ubiquinone/menaquinone biosynthesis C-methylase UbiE